MIDNFILLLIPNVLFCAWALSPFIGIYSQLLWPLLGYCIGYAIAIKNKCTHGCFGAILMYAYIGKGNEATPFIIMSIFLVTLYLIYTYQIYAYSRHYMLANNSENNN